MQSLFAFELKDTLFKAKNMNPYFFGVEFGYGNLRNQNIPINNFSYFNKFELGLRFHLKKAVLGCRMGQLYSKNKNAGNVKNRVVNGEFNNNQFNFFIGYLITSPKYIGLEPIISYTLNRGYLLYDSLRYTNYSGNVPENIYNLNSLGAGVNAYININSIWEKLLYGFPLYIYVNYTVSMPFNQFKYLNQQLHHFSIGITLYTFSYRSNHF
jgi:hypothetical protein